MSRRASALRWDDTLAFADAVQATGTRLPAVFCDMLRGKVR